MFSVSYLKVTTLLFLLFTLFLLAPSYFAVIHAEQRTCCTDAGGGAASGNCDGCRAVGVETKNNGDSCGSSSSCVVCDSSHPRSNVCGSSNSGGGSNINTAAICNYFGITPTVASVQVGKTTSIGFTVQQGTWDKLVVVNPNPAIATTNPVQFNGKSLLNAPSTYQYLALTVTALKVGTVSMTIDQYATYPGYMNLYCSRPFTINVIAASTPAPTVTPTVAPSSTPTSTPAPTSIPNACTPGARCDIVGNGRVQKGSVSICSMPAVLSAPLNTQVSYELSCVYFDASGKATTTKVSKTSTIVAAQRAVFASFPIAYSAGTYKCGFRSCNAISGVKTCTAWGN